MKYEYHIIVIGAGSGGLVVSSGASSIGAKVALIEADKMGGDCLNTGCVPSKSFLKSAHLVSEILNSKKFGITTSSVKVDMASVMKRVRSVIKSIEPHDSVERYESLGVDVFKGKGVLLDPHTVKIKNTTLTAKFIVIATGSEPSVPPIPGLKNVPYLTNKNIFNLKSLPEKMIVLGGGPIGLELGQGFRHLGSQVEIIDMADQLFPKDDPEVAPIMEKILSKEGIKLNLSSSIVEVKKKGKKITVVIEKNGKKSQIDGDQLLVSLGRKPVTQNMGLEDTGIEIDKRGYITTNKKLQTSIKNIYACGDATGPFQFTHMAGYQAGVIIRNILFPLIKSDANYSAVPWTTYTRPEVAHVGYTEPWARDLGIYKESIIVDISEIDRAKAENDLNGFLKLIVGKGKKIIGATIVGNKAGEMIPVATMAIKQQLKSTAFMSLIFSYPTEAEIYKFASLADAKKSFKPWMKKLIQNLLLR